MDDLSDIRELYNASWDQEASRLMRHQLEADLTWRHLDSCLPACGRLLEIGCGTGFYTFPLTERGYEVTAIDLAEDYVTRCRAKAEELGLSSRVDFQVGDARRLDGIPPNRFDAALLMGPLYHLACASDRTAALRCAYGTLKPGGVIISTMISRFAVLADLIKGNPTWIDDEEHVRSHITNGHRPDGAPRGGFRGYYVRLDEIAPMHERVGFHTLRVAGVEPVIASDDESYNALVGRQRELWLDLLFEVGAEPSMVAGSRHVLYVGRKPGGQ